MALLREVRPTIIRAKGSDKQNVCSFLALPGGPVLWGIVMHCAWISARQELSTAFLMPQVLFQLRGGGMCLPWTSDCRPKACDSYTEALPEAPKLKVVPR